MVISSSLTAQNVNSILATVNGEPITLLDVILETKDKENMISSTYSGDVAAEERKKVRKMAVERIIEDKIILREFRQRGYKVPIQMIERMLDSIASEIADGGRRKLEDVANENGMSLEKLRKKAEERAAVELMLNEFCSRRLSISPKELQKYCDEKAKEKLPCPEVELYVILVKKTEGEGNGKDNIIKKISEDVKQNNKSIFTTLATLYSETPSATKGGRLGWVAKNRLRPEFKKALEGLELGKASPQIMTDDGVYFIFLADQRDSVASGASEDVEKIKEDILNEKREEARKIFVEKLRRNAIVRYFY